MTTIDPVATPGPGLPSDFPIKKAHFVGICGAGMYPIARAMIALGIEVSGSDPSAGGKCADLASLGAVVYTEHAAVNVRDPDVIVFSTAIPPDNPELVVAREKGIRLVHRSEMLAWYLGRYESILVAGTHGKTTTSTMAAIVLERGGLDPWAFIGGSVPEFGGNLRFGGKKYAVAEADESDGSFLCLPRNHAIITNIEAEHLNYWGTEENLFQGFVKFMAGIPDDGILVMNGDDPGVQHVSVLGAHKAVYYSLKNRNAEFFADEITLHGEGSEFSIHYDQVLLGKVKLAIPGIHNVENALGVFALAISLGAKFADISGALAHFQGVSRRFTKSTSPHGFLIIDDYGHHPTEIAATMGAARQLANERGGKLHVVLQPHRNSRTQSFFHQFAPSLRAADFIVVTDIYSAGEEAIEGVSGEILALNIAGSLDCEVIYIEPFDEIKKAVLLRVKKADIVLLLGAGSITKLANLLSC